MQARKFRLEGPKGKANKLLHSPWITLKPVQLVQDKMPFYCTFLPLRDTFIRIRKKWNNARRNSTMSPWEICQKNYHVEKKMSEIRTRMCFVINDVIFSERKRKLCFGNIIFFIRDNLFLIKYIFCVYKNILIMIRK